MQAIKRIAFTLIGDGAGTGGYNYLLNLLRAINAYATDRLTPVLFVGNEVRDEDLAPFRAVPAAEIVRTALFDAKGSRKRSAQAVLLGSDAVAARCFEEHAIDVVFESAMFYGRRFPIPVIAWLSDFQHRHLPHLFGKLSYWRRELGFRAQIASGRSIMVSSEDARTDCERFYPSSVGRTAVVRFAVPADLDSAAVDLLQIVRHYDLPEHFYYLPNQFWKHKNHRVVINALHILKQQGKHVVVAASGKPVDPRHPRHYQEIQSLVATLGLTRNFRFLGMVPRQHLIALMRACAALINPSSFEGWSTPVEEARALGVPMLLSNLRVHREQVGDTAQFFAEDSAEQLAALLTVNAELSIASRREREKAAAEAAEHRVRQFCRDFLQTVESASASLHSA